VRNGETKTLIGKKTSRYRLRFDGGFKGNNVTGAATDGEGELFLVQYRVTKRIELT